MIPIAYKIDDILIISKVYPFDDNQEIQDDNQEIQENNQISYCNKYIDNLYKCPIYIIGYTLCIPCITINLCIYTCCCVCRCNAFLD